MGTITHNDHCSTSANDIGVVVHITCPVCEREMAVQYNYAEIGALLEGRQIPGHQSDGRGWTSTMKCYSRNSGVGCGKDIKFRVGVQDFLNHYRNYKLGGGR